MGNQPSAPSDKQNPTSATPQHQHQSSQSLRSSQGGSQHKRGRGSRTQRELVAPAPAPAASGGGSTNSVAGTLSEAGSRDYTLTPASSLSPSISRVEAQHHYSHRHGSSLDTQFVPAPGAAVDPAMGAASSSEKLPKQRPVLRDRTNSGSPHAKPVSVPVRSRSLRQRDESLQPDGSDTVRSSGPPRDSTVSSSYGAAQPAFHHPPRLPLPIQEEEYTPGSPVLTAQDFTDDTTGTVDDELDEEGLTPNKSLLSHTTVDDDEEQYQDSTDPDHRRRTVPTEVTWDGRGEKIYVTGTFANWSKKFRMQRDRQTGVARTILDLLPGTHHVRFIVDGEMQLSNALPTAVDYTNTLVNYIEVSADTAFRPEPPQHQDMPRMSEQAPESIHPPLVLPPSAGVDAHDHDPKAPSTPLMQVQEQGKPGELGGPELMEQPHKHYGQQVPGYLLDLDRDERSARFARANAKVADIPPPPTLPGFLSKSILNGTMPMKDDSSVLNMPNHTVLNHLATSSIRSGVLATSLTTRYKRKYVTLITYRPTSSDD